MALYDVGIVGCWYWGNYGSLLNGYATFAFDESEEPLDSDFSEL